MKTIALIGNPNCGKSTLFNALTGGNERVGNWSGVTMEKAEGFAQVKAEDGVGERIKIVDLPGCYSLNAASEDERIALKYVLSHEADVYVNVVDATALERNLYLTILLCELKVPMIVVVTMMDIARHRNITIDLGHLSEHLGVPVIGINANNPVDINRLKRELTATLNLQPSTFNLQPSLRIAYGNELEQEIDILASCTVKTAQALKVSREWVALKALEGEPLVTQALIDYHDMAPEVIEGAIRRVTEVLADPPDIELAEARYGIIAGLVRDVVRERKSKLYFSEMIDRFVLNRYLGLPLFFAIMAGVFMLVSFAGGTPTEFCHHWGKVVFQDIPSAFATSTCGGPAWLGAVVSGVGGAFNILFSFVPVIFCMFLALSILEDSGYISRAAFLADRLMRGLGLPGKSFVPLLIGFGCTVPAILATRMLDSKRDRLLTVFMIPFMSCGAKLPVYAAFAVAFSPEAPWKVLLALYFSGIVLGVLMGLVLKKTLFRGTPAHFIMELPPYHLPRPKHIFLHTWELLTGFLFRAGQFIIPMMLVLGILNSFDIHGRPCTDEGETANTLLSTVGRAATPVFEPIGVEKDNWPASVAIFTGLFAKESVISTMNGLYTQMKQTKARGEGEEDGMARTMREHFPKGFHQAFSYLLFILLYVPCLGATAVIFREIGKAYGAIFVTYMTLLGWSVATIYHALAVSHSVTMLATGVAIILAMIGFFALYGRRHRVDLVK